MGLGYQCVARKSFLVKTMTMHRPNFLKELLLCVVFAFSLCYIFHVYFFYPEIHEN